MTISLSVPLNSSHFSLSFSLSLWLHSSVLSLLLAIPLFFVWAALKIGRPRLPGCAWLGLFWFADKYRYIVNQSIHETLLLCKHFSDKKREESIEKESAFTLHWKSSQLPDIFHYYWRKETGKITAFEWFDSKVVNKEIYFRGWYFYRLLNIFAKCFIWFNQGRTLTRW